MSKTYSDAIHLASRTLSADSPTLLSFEPTTQSAPIWHATGTNGKLQSLIPDFYIQLTTSLDDRAESHYRRQRLKRRYSTTLESRSLDGIQALALSLMTMLAEKCLQSRGTSKQPDVEEALSAIGAGTYVLARNTLGPIL